jgi:hypothetical protein
MLVITDESLIDLFSYGKKYSANHTRRRIYRLSQGSVTCTKKRSAVQICIVDETPDGGLRTHM